MTTAIDYLQPGQQHLPSSAKPLWAAVGILGVAVLAMGGTMIYQQRPPVPLAPVALVAPVAALPLAAASTASAMTADDLIEKPVVASKPAPVPAKKVVKPTPRPAPAPVYSSNAPYPSAAPAPVYAPAPVVAQVCATCGSVESVTAVQRSTKPDGPGVGVLAGGVAGAVLGNQVGRGNGRAAATILGAIGGGWAGNAIERNVRKETVYQVSVRMDDGSRRTIEVAQPPGIGSKVTVNGSQIRSNDGAAVYNPPPPVMQRTRLPQQPSVQQQNY